MGRVDAWVVPPALPGRFCETVSAEVARGIGMHQFCESGASTVDPALDRSNHYPTNLGGLLIGQPFCSHEENGLTLFGRKPHQSRSKVCKIKVSCLLGRDGEPLVLGTIDVFHLTAATPMVRVEQVP